MQNSTLTVTEAKALIKTKEHYYKAMHKNMWYLPSYRSTIITQEYMKGVRDQSIWCPRYQDRKPLPCTDPPPKRFLIKEILAIAQSRQLNLGIEDNKTPDKQWLIEVIAILDTNHEIFKKDYLPPIQDSKRQQKVIDNGDDFFTNLPSLFKQRDLKAKSKLKEFQIAHEEERVKHLKEYKAQIEKRIVEHGEKLKILEKRQRTVTIDFEEWERIKNKLQMKEKEEKKRAKGRTPSKV